jgi:hypothetical protein
MRLLPRLALAGLLFGGCSEVEPPVWDAGDPGGLPPESFVLPAHCDRARQPPETLECTGLYSDIGLKILAPGVRGYTPAFALWSDGAEKNRWISLPPGTTIDGTDPKEWVFPVGTKLWKEFVMEGRRVETRLWQKASPTFWVNGTYAWNAEESAATRNGGGDIPFGSGTYHIPTQDECEKCHRGRTEHILGFGAVELGLPGAAGMTLETLAAEGLLSPPPASTSLTIGDDGTGAAAPALGWLHANCGATCHNENQLAPAFQAGMRLRLDPAHLDGRPVADLPLITTTIGVTVQAASWRGRVRIVAGDPEQSLLYSLISRRGSGMQMPPVASNVVDQENVARVGEWIRRMAAPPAPADPPDAATPDPAVEADAGAGPPADASP